MEIQLKKSLNNYCSELDDILKRVEEDKNYLISLISEHRGNLQDREYMRSCIHEKFLCFHDLFFNQCINIINDTYLSHTFELASPQNLLCITLETKQKLTEFYFLYQYQLNLDYFDRVIKNKYDDEDCNAIKTNKILDNYIKLDNKLNVIVDSKVMISHIYQLIKNNGNI